MGKELIVSVLKSEEYIDWSVEVPGMFVERKGKREQYRASKRTRLRGRQYGREE